MYYFTYVKLVWCPLNFDLLIIYWVWILLYMYTRKSRWVHLLRSRKSFSCNAISRNIAKSPETTLYRRFIIYDRLRCYLVSRRHLCAKFVHNNNNRYYCNILFYTRNYGSSIYLPPYLFYRTRQDRGRYYTLFK